jgi:hypothetical protein
MLLTSNRPVIGLLTIGFAIAGLGIFGCGNRPSDKTEVTDNGSTSDDSVNTEETVAPKQKKSGKGKKPGKGGEAAHIGEIPKDVWPEIWLKDPLSVAAETGTAAGSLPGAAASQEEKPAPTEVASADSNEKHAVAAAKKPGEVDWKALIAGEVLADETKSLKNKLTASLQDKGRYDSTYKVMRTDAAVLAVLAAIAPDVPDTPSWKSNAKYVRDTASTVATVSEANGPQFYKKAKDAYDKLDALLTGSKPPDVAESADHIDFSEFGNRRYLMLRMDRIKNWMKSDVNAEGIFKKEASKVAQEASVLAVLAQVIATPGYDGYDADDYREFASTITQSALGIVTAAKDGDFKTYTSLLGAYDKACLKCHEVYKNN